MRNSKVNLWIPGLVALLAALGILLWLNAHDEPRTPATAVPQTSNGLRPQTPNRSMSQTSNLPLPQTPNRPISQTSNRPFPQTPNVSVSSLPPAVMADSLSNVGYASPRAAYETFMYATREADVELISNSITLDADARQKAIDFIGAQPEAIQAQLRNPEYMAALVLASSPSVPVTGKLIVGAATPVGPNGVMLDTHIENNGTTSQAIMDFRHAPDGWKAVIPSPYVDLAIKSFGEKTTP